LQTKVSRVLGESNEKKIKWILQQLQTKRKKWHPNNKNACCGSFYCVNDNSKVNLDVPQMIRCLLCHFQLVVSMNSRKRLRKGLVTYYKTSGITCLQKHLDVDHSVIYKRLKNNLQRKGLLFPIFSYLNFLLQKTPSKGWCGTKDVCGKYCTFNNEKLFSFAICGKCVVKV
jgi:hypothetical protein